MRKRLGEVAFLAALAASGGCETEKQTSGLKDAVVSDTLNDGSSEISGNEILPEKGTEKEKRGFGAENLNQWEIIQAEMLDRINLIDINLITPHLPEEIRGKTDDEKREYLVQRIKATFLSSASLVQKNRFQNEASEQQYFDLLFQKKQRERIFSATKTAEEITGVPSGLLQAVGFIESKYRTGAVNASTDVYGPYQIALKTAPFIANFAQRRFGEQLQQRKLTLGFQKKDLHNLENSSILTAAYIILLKERYGSYDLAIAAYAGGPENLERKIKEKFFEVDLGSEEKTKIDFCLAQIIELKRRYKETKSRDLLDTIKILNDNYRVFFAEWKAKRNSMKSELARHGVSVATLFDTEILNFNGDVCDFSKSHSLSYPMSLDFVGGLIQEQTANALELEKAARAKQKTKKLDVKADGLKKVALRAQTHKRKKR